MPTKVGLYGSEITKGTNDSRISRGRLRCLVEGNANTTAGVSAAIADTIAAVGPTHPGDSSLPLQAVTATRWGPSKVWTVAEFFHRGADLSQPAFVQADLELTHEQVRIFRWVHDATNTPQWTGAPTPGWPNGEWIGGEPPANDPAFRMFQTRLIRRGVIRMRIPTELAADPMPSIGQLVNRINVDNLTFGAYTFTPGQVRFDGALVRWFWNGSANRYRVIYTFTLSEIGHVQQRPKYNTSTPGWETVIEPTHEFKTFAGQFPVHA